MNKTLIKSMLPALVAVAMTACSAEDSPLADGTGRIAPEVGLDTEVAAARSARAADGDITAENLVLALTSADGSYSNSWNGVSAFPLDEKFKTGDYTMTASYGALEDEGFEKPFYFGSTDLKVTENNTTHVSLTAQLANSMVSVEYSDNFKDYMSDWSSELHATGGEYIFYAKDETRPAYLRPGATTVNVSITKPNGTKATLQAANFTTEPRHHYHVTVDLRQGAGDAVLVVHFDESVDQEDIEIELSDELMNAPAPTISAQSFTPGTALAFVSGMAPESLAPKFAVMARGGLASVVLTTSSKSLASQGWPEEIDLMAAPENMQSRMRALGFDCLGLWKNPDKMAVVDLSGVLNHIAYLESGSNAVSFTLQVKDRFNKLCETPLTLNLIVEKLELTLSNALVSGDEITMAMAYNGSDAENNVKFQYKNSRGTWTALTVNSMQPTARAGESYSVSLAVPNSDESFTIKAVCGNNESNEITAKYPFELACDDKDVFATRAKLSVTGEDDSPENLAAKGKIYLSTDGGKTFTPASQSVSGGNFSLSGLEAGTDYKARVLIDGIYSPSLSFTTEQARQIPNGSLDADVSPNGSGSNWQNVVFQGWGTNNPMTTSQGGNYAYVRISGTKQTDDAHSGKAVQIRTNGWGSGNTAVGSVKGTCKYIDAGLLHLGASRTTRPSGYSDRAGSLLTDDLDCGIAFDSRPASVNFWFKYSPKNSNDKGLAKAVVYDAAGNIIAEGAIDLSSQNEYVQKTIALTYAAGAAKAAKIYVLFQSTNVADALTLDANWITPPPFGGSLGRAEYSGSTLYIDDVTLNY
ncbi:MAG: DUF4493 domain-containing protein [Muribaculaceae bacterium]|nr:DUF4493 domain-containing protein [Muribaculaceae bacterium]